MKRTIHISVLASLAAAPAGATPLQEQQPFTQDSRQQEMIDLFHDVELELMRIDETLAEAGAGVPLSDVGNAGIDRLLRDATSSSTGVCNKIDRILEIAQELSQSQNPQSCPNPGQGQPQPGGESPLNHRQGDPLGREQTPEGPQPDGQGQEEKPGGEEPQPEPDGEKPGEGERPDSDKPDEPGGENRPDDPDGRLSGQPTMSESDAEAWGSLPIRTRELFRNQGREDLPLQYRDWIDAYYRRLNQTP